LPHGAAPESNRPSVGLPRRTGLKTSGVTPGLQVKLSIRGLCAPACAPVRRLARSRPLRRNSPVARLRRQGGRARADRGRDLGEVFDHSNQLLRAVALLAREAHKLTRARDNLTALGRPSDRDPAPAPELEQPFVA
jgi:hypothetical protein